MDIPAIMPVMVILLILEFGEIMEVGFKKIYLLQNPVWLLPLEPSLLGYQGASRSHCRAPTSSGATS